MTGYLEFEVNNLKYRVAIVKFKPTLFWIFRGGFKERDMKPRWRSVISKSRQKFILKLMEEKGLLKALEESK